MVVSVDLLFVTVLCPALELELTLLLPVAADLGVVLLFCPELRVLVPLLTLLFERREFPVPVACCLPLTGAPVSDLLPVVVTDSLVPLSGCACVYNLSPSFLCSGCE